MAKERETNSKREAKKTQKNNKSKTNREFAIVTYCFLGIFVAMIAYMFYFQITKAETIINNPYNKRQQIFADSVIRGDIISSDDEVLATTKVSSGGKEVRVYPHKNMFAHAIGYSTNGTTGVESMANFPLLRTHSFIGNQVMNMLEGKKNVGDTVVTTLSYKLQKTAYQALGSYDGAVVALDPQTGKILAMVSKPDYDPNDVLEHYDQLIGDTSHNNSNSVLLNRATQGGYTPGSIFKIFTTLEYLAEHNDQDNFSYECKGSVTTEGYKLRCSHSEVHGNVSLKDAFAKSCNCAYATIGLSLNMSSFASLGKNMLFQSPLPIDYPYTQSVFSLNKDCSEASIMQGSIGQYKTTVSPIHMAMVVSAIANDGVLMKPYVIDKVKSDADITVLENDPEDYGRLMTKDTARMMQSYMEACVSYGTGKKLKTDTYTAAGKTGSAEVSDSTDDTHSWFVGYAKDESGKTIVIAVIVEKIGNGSKYAVPIAKKVFDSYFEK